ncbi:MAG: Tetratricopeptide 2 repeat protein [Bryobacterales bacterium]|nr:Tetratricopeptide 2 repeat protein [Bryobacterales bacterium]
MHSSILRRLVLIAMFVFSATLFAQRLADAQRPADGYVPPGERYGDVPDDVTAERPHTLFEHWEQTLTKSSPQQFASSGPATGTVSVDQLRHPLSGKGERLIEKGQHYAKAGDHTKAINEYKHALDEPSSVPYAHSLLGIEYLRTGDPSAAIVELNEAVRLMPRVAANHSNLGYAFLLTGKRDMAEGELRLAIKLDQDTPQARYLLGLLLLDQKSSEAAESLGLAQRIVKNARLALAIFHVRHGEPDAAKQDLRAYLGAEWPQAGAEAERWVTEAAQMERPSAMFGIPAESR